jgi:ribosomal protein S18 acetylase RimI-like enzyme
MSPRSRSRGLFFWAAGGRSVVVTAGPSCYFTVCFTDAARATASGQNLAMEISVVDAASDELVAAFSVLLPQLSSSASPISRVELQAIVDSPASSLLVARDGGRVVGTLTLAVFRIPTGVRAWIEDVVVDESARGRGVGEALTLRAVELAREAGARSVELTSRPTREAANRLYRRLGFEERETNVLRLTLQPGDAS